jgi:thiamine biosynthesis protein ThiS
MTMPRITLNGEERQTASRTLAELAGELKLEGRPFAIEHNREVVPKARLAERTLNDGDRVEVVEFVGGG